MANEAPEVVEGVDRILLNVAPHISIICFNEKLFWCNTRKPGRPVELTDGEKILIGEVAQQGNFIAQLITQNQELLRERDATLRNTKETT